METKHRRKAVTDAQKCNADTGYTHENAEWDSNDTYRKGFIKHHLPKLLLCCADGGQQPELLRSLRHRYGKGVIDQ